MLERLNGATRNMYEATYEKLQIYLKHNSTIEEGENNSKTHRFELWCDLQVKKNIKAFALCQQNKTTLDRQL